MPFATVPDEFTLAIPLKLAAAISTDRSSGCRAHRRWMSSAAVSNSAMVANCRASSVGRRNRRLHTATPPTASGLQNRNLPFLRDAAFAVPTVWREREA